MPSMKHRLRSAPSTVTQHPLKQRLGRLRGLDTGRKPTARRRYSSVRGNLQPVYRLPNCQSHGLLPPLPGTRRRHLRMPPPRQRGQRHCWHWSRRKRVPHRNRTHRVPGRRKGSIGAPSLNLPDTGRTALRSRHSRSRQRFAPNRSGRMMKRRIGHRSRDRTHHAALPHPTGLGTCCPSSVASRPYPHRQPPLPPVRRIRPWTILHRQE